MPMIRLASCLPVILACSLLAGCNGGSSTTYGTDGRSYSNGVQNTTPGEYSGRVMDGYLRNARVWLDLNGNGVYDSSPVTITSGNETITLPNGEPTAMTGSGGAFTLDVSGLEQDPKVAPSADPRDYSLMAVAIPGVTVDESTGATVSTAYLMTAKPGVTVVSPLTTVEQAIDSYCTFGTTCAASNATVQSYLGVQVNLEEDYVKANNQRSQAYAKTIAYFLQLQTPAAVTSSLQGTDGISAQGFSSAAVPVINRVLVTKSPGIFKAVDDAAAAAGGNYALVSPDSLSLPSLALDYTDPMVVTKQKFYVHNDNSTPPKAEQDGNSNIQNYLAGTLTWYYDTAGRPTKVESDGYMEPSLIELARMANAGGEFGKLDSQVRNWFFSAFNPGSSIVGDGIIDERMIFDWDNHKALFYSTYSGHGATGSALGTTGDTPQDTYQWTVDTQGRVDSVSDNNTSLAITYSGTSNTITQYKLTDNVAGTVKTWAFGTATTCDDNSGSYRLVTHRVPLTYTDSSGAPVYGGHSTSWDYDTRSGRNQLLRAPFYDLSIYTQDWLQWSYTYYSTPLDNSQPDLVQQASLTTYSPDSTCSGTTATTDPVSVGNNYFMLINYSYEQLSKYVLEEAGTGN